MPEPSEKDCPETKRAVADIAAGAADILLTRGTKAKLAFIVCGGMVAAVLYAMYIGGQKGDLAFVERALFIIGGAATTVISTFMGVNAALSAGRNGNGNSNGTKG